MNTTPAERIQTNIAKHRPLLDRLAREGDCIACAASILGCAAHSRLPRTWTIESVGARPLTTNKVANLHRRTWARHTKEIRRQWKALAEAAGVQHIDACTITVTPLHANHASPQDVAACAPEAKAAIDGLVDAGLLDNDGPTHVLAVLFLPPRVCGANGLELVITETAA